SCCRSAALASRYLFVSLNDPASTEIYTLSLHDALPISAQTVLLVQRQLVGKVGRGPVLEQLHQRFGHGRLVHQHPRLGIEHYGAGIEVDGTDEELLAIEHEGLGVQTGKGLGGKGTGPLLCTASTSVVARELVSTRTSTPCSAMSIRNTSPREPGMKYADISSSSCSAERRWRIRCRASIGSWLVACPGSALVGGSEIHSASPQCQSIRSSRRARLKGDSSTACR